MWESTKYTFFVFMVSPCVSHLPDPVHSLHLSSISHTITLNLLPLSPASLYPLFFPLLPSLLVPSALHFPCPCHLTHLSWANVMVQAEIEAITHRWLWREGAVTSWNTMQFILNTHCAFGKHFLPTIIRLEHHHAPFLCRLPGAQNLPQKTEYFCILDCHLWLLSNLIILF